MTKSENNSENIIEQAVQQFVEAQLQGQKPNIDEFVKQYPEFESQIRLRLQNLDEIDSLFDCLMQADDSNFGDAINEHNLVGQEFGENKENIVPTVVDFEDLIPGTTYNLNDSFTASGVQITGEEFFYYGGSSAAEGFARVENIGVSGGTNNELAIHNLNLNFDFGTTLGGLTLQYGEFGGNINVEINGDLINVDNFADIPKTVGGTIVSTLDEGIPGKSSGAMFIVGKINSFKIGGQELWIDNIVPSIAPNQQSPTIPKFKILRQIGQGGMGAVFLAKQISLNRYVALKIISDVSKTQNKSLERFKREAKIMAKISHPNIVPIYEVGQQGPYSYFAMEYVEGVSLDKILQSIRNVPSNEKASGVMHKCLESQAGIYDKSFLNDESSKGAEIDTEYIFEISKIIIGIASALGYAHKKGILHRDVKPSNILIASDGTAKLVDFGLAKAETQQTITLTGEFFGTPNYVSPEQIRKPEIVDHRSDVYSLAATYYECLTLHLPFEGNTVNETLAGILSHDVTPPKKHSPRLSTDFNTVLLHALEKSPEDRYQTVAEFAADIGNVLDFKPIKAKRSSITQRTYKTLRRNPLKVVAVGVILLLVVLGVILSSIYIQKRNWDISREFYTSGIRRYELNDLPGAIKFFEKAVKINPNFAESYYNIGECYYSLKKYNEAIEAYNNAISIDPDHAASYWGLGLSYYELEDFKEAVDSYKNSIKIDSNNIETHLGLGDSYLGLNLYEEAIHSYRQICKFTDYKDHSYIALLAVVYAKAGNFEEAIKCQKEAIDLADDETKTEYKKRLEAYEAHKHWRE